MPTISLQTGKIEITPKQTGIQDGIFFAARDDNFSSKQVRGYAFLNDVNIYDKSGVLLHSYNGVSNISYIDEGYIVITQIPVNPEPYITFFLENNSREIHDVSSLITYYDMNTGEHLLFPKSKASFALAEAGTGDFLKITISSDTNELGPYQKLIPGVFPVPDVWENVKGEEHERIVDLKIVNLKSLFTPGKDTVDFNKLSAADVKDVIQYHNAFGGDDTITLPNYLVSTDLPENANIPLPSQGLPWNRSFLFEAGEGNDKVTGGNAKDYVSLGAGNDTWVGSYGNDDVAGNEGNDVFDYSKIRTAAFAVSSVVKLDGGSAAPGAHAEVDILRLPGSSSDYVFVPSLSDAPRALYSDQTTYIVSAGGWKWGPPEEAPIAYEVKNIERVEFATVGPNNIVKLQSGSIIAEMAMLAKEVYGLLPSPEHKAEPLYLQTSPNSAFYSGPANEQPGTATPKFASTINVSALETNYITSNAIGRNWHPLSAMELGLPNSHLPDVVDKSFESGIPAANSIGFSIYAGHYQAINSNDLKGSDIVTGDTPEANALVLTGVVDGKKSLAVVFRGTDQKADFLDYANFARHYAKFEPLLAKLEAYIKDNDITQVFAAGHSLGAGMVEYFLADPRFATKNVYAYTWGSPGSDANVSSLAATRLTNFIHDEDPVAAVVGLFNDAAKQTQVLYQAANKAIGQTMPNTDVSRPKVIEEMNAEFLKQGLLDPISKGLLDIVLPKERHGVTVTINTPKSHELQQNGNLLNLEMNEHSMLLYGQDMIHLTTQHSSLVPALANDPFAYINSGLASYLRDPLHTRLTNDVQIAISTPNSNSYNATYGREIWVSAKDTYVLGNQGANRIILDPYELNSVKLPGDQFKIFRVIDGGGEVKGGTITLPDGKVIDVVISKLADTLVLPGHFNDYYIVNNERGQILYKVMPHGTPDVNIAKLISIEKLEFAWFNEAGNLSSRTYKLQEYLDLGLSETNHFVGDGDPGGELNEIILVGSSQAISGDEVLMASASASVDPFDPFGILGQLGAGASAFSTDVEANRYAQSSDRGISSTLLYTPASPISATGAKDVLDLSRFRSDAVDVAIVNGEIALTVAGLTKSVAGVERVVFSDGVLGFDINGTAGLAYRIYQAAFAREPDVGGLTFWFSQMDKGMSVNAVAAAYLTSAEFQSLYGANPANDAYITLLYNNVLGRPPDQEGIDFWVRQMSGGLSRESMLIQFSESAENKDLTLYAIERGVWFDLIV